MGITDNGAPEGRQLMSLAAARTAWQTGKPAGAIERWTPAITATGYPALLGSIAGVDVRIAKQYVAGLVGMFVIGQAQPASGRQGWWDHVANGRTLTDAHAAAWRILAPRDPAQGVLAQLAAQGVPMAPGWRR